jgi:hypothetical protein
MATSNPELSLVKELMKDQERTAFPGANPAFQAQSRRTPGDKPRRLQVQLRKPQRDGGLEVALAAPALGLCAVRVMESRRV